MLMVNWTLLCFGVVANIDIFKVIFIVIVFQDIFYSIWLYCMKLSLGFPDVIFSLVFSYWNFLLWSTGMWMRQSVGLRRRSSWWHLMILVVTSPAFKPCSGNTRGWKETWQPWRTRSVSAYFFFQLHKTDLPNYINNFFLIVLLMHILLYTYV